MSWTGAWSAVTVTTALCPACTVVLPETVSCGTVLDTIVVVADDGAPTV